MKKNNKIKYIIIGIGLIIVIAIIIITFVINKDDSSNKKNNNKLEETTTTQEVYYSGNILSANENWIGLYEVGTITGCVYNNDKSGVYDNNTDYSCSDGVTCCTGDMEVEYAFNGGSSLGGGMAESNVLE